MNKLFLIACGFFLVCGAGCSSLISVEPAVSVPVETGTPSPEGLIEFQQGFGMLPGKNPNPVESKVDQMVSVRANWDDLPEFPSVVTVIRKRTALPNSTVLKNITSAMNVPIGTLASEPVSKGAIVSWKDESGYAWTYDAEIDRLDFEKKGSAIPLTSSVLQSDDALIQSANQFILDKGLLSSEWGAPYLVYSWSGWKEERMAKGQCMTDRTMKIIQKMAEESSLNYELIPSLASLGSGACVSEEAYPNLQVVRYSLRQDGESVYGGDGIASISAEVYIRMDTREAVMGWVELKRDADRSNYITLQPDRLKAYLEKGGITGFPTNAKSFDVNGFTKGSYRYVAEVDGVHRTFFIPAIQAQGMLTYWNGTVIPYAIVVTLTREDQFVGK